MNTNKIVLSIGTEQTAQAIARALEFRFDTENLTASVTANDNGGYDVTVKFLKWGSYPRRVNNAEISKIKAFVTGFFMGLEYAEKTGIFSK